jgi:hypothetical protein
MTEADKIDRIFHPVDQSIAAAVTRVLELRSQRIDLESTAPAFDPLHFDPLVQLLEFPGGGLMERVGTRLSSLRVFFRYERLLTRRCRSLTNARLHAVSEGVPLRLESIVADDRVIRLSLRRLRVAALLYFLGYAEAIELARVSRDELIRVFGSPADAPA